MSKSFIVCVYEIRFLKGRLKFGDCKTAAPFPSMIVVMRPERLHRILMANHLTGYGWAPRSPSSHFRALD